MQINDLHTLDAGDQTFLTVVQAVTGHTDQALAGDQTALVVQAADVKAQRQEGERLSWLAVLFPALMLIALVTSLLLTLLAPWLVQLLGPGLAASATALAGSNLQIVAWCVPGLMLHALFSIPLPIASP